MVEGRPSAQRHAWGKWRWSASSLREIAGAASPSGRSPLAAHRWLLSGMLVFMLCVSSITAVAHADTSYRVQAGDNLTSIAYRYGTTVQAIVAANGLASPSTIYVGQLLTIPSASAKPASPPASTAGGSTYTVQPNDNLSALAARFGVTREALAAANGISPSSFLYVGQVLKIPGQVSQPQSTPTTPPPTATSIPPLPTSTVVAAQPTTTPQPVVSAPGAQPGKPAQYTVQRGDSLSSIAAKFSTTVQALMQLNNMSDPNFLRVGQVITLVKGDDQNNNAPSPTATTATSTGTPPAEPTPPMGAFGPKWVDVSLNTQTMIAYEGQTPVFTSKISSGVARHPTVIGTYRIYAKYRYTRMKGGEGAEAYDIPNVPYTMYFYSDYGLHGAFWHNNFGHPMSHGCVNLPVDVSKWMFDWAPIGTMVITHP